MPEVGIEATVQKMVSKASSEAVTKAASEAPETEPVKTEQTRPEAQPTTDDTTRGTNGLTAFEQELVDELESEDKTAFESLTAQERTSRLAWMKRRYRKDARQMTELGNLRKAVKALADAGVTQEDLVKLVQGKRGSNGKTSTESAAVTAARGYARLMEKAANPEERESLREAESVLKEMMEDIVEAKLGQRVKPLEEKLSASESRTHQERSRTLAKDIDDLEDVQGYPGSLVETYRATLQEAGERNPHLSAEDLLFKLADPKDLKAALLKKKDVAEKPAHREPKPASVIKTTTTSPELPKRRSGALSIMSSLDKLVQFKRK